MSKDKAMTEKRTKYRINSESEPEARFALQIRVSGLPEPEREWRFHPIRRWRFDFAWPDLMLAVEIEGGIYVSGRHTRGAGFEEDCRKYAEAVCMGWRVLRLPAGWVETGEALRYLEYAIRSVDHE